MFAFVIRLTAIFIGHTRAWLSLPVCISGSAARSLSVRGRGALPGGTSQLAQKCRVDIDIESQPLGRWRRHHVDIKYQLSRSDLTGRILGCIESRRTRDECPALYQASEKRVDAGQDRRDQRVRYRLIHELQHRQIDGFLDHIHRSPDAYEIVGGGNRGITGRAIPPYAESRSERIEHRYYSARVQVIHV